MKFFLLALMIAAFASVVPAEESTLEKVQGSSNSAIDSTKEGVRSLKDKSCEAFNGKMECAGKRIKHGAQNFSDKAKSGASRLKNKID